MNHNLNRIRTRRDYIRKVNALHSEDKYSTITPNQYTLHANVIKVKNFLYCFYAPATNYKKITIKIHLQITFTSRFLSSSFFVFATIQYNSIQCSNKMPFMDIFNCILKAFMLIGLQRFACTKAMLTKAKFGRE